MSQQGVNIPVGIDDTRFRTGAKNIVQSFEEIKGAGKSAYEEIGKAADGAASKTSNFEKEEQKKDATMKRGIATSIAAVSSVWGLYNAYDSIEKKLFLQKKINNDIIDTRHKLNDLERAGKTNTFEYAQGVRTLNEQLEKQAMIADDVKQAQIQMGLSMVTTVAIVIPNMITALKGLNFSLHALKLELTAIATHPVFLIAVAALAAWELAIAPLIKSYNGLDLSISGNISKLFEQGNAVQATSGHMEKYNTTMKDTISTQDALTASQGKSKSMLIDLVSFWKNVNEQALNNAKAQYEVIKAEKALQTELKKNKDNLTGTATAIKQVDNAVRNADPTTKGILDVLFKPDLLGTAGKAAAAGSPTGAMVAGTKPGSASRFFEKVLANDMLSPLAYHKGERMYSWQSPQDLIANWQNLSGGTIGLFDRSGTPRKTQISYPGAGSFETSARELDKERIEALKEKLRDIGNKQKYSAQQIEIAGLIQVAQLGQQVVLQLVDQWPEVYDRILTNKIEDIISGKSKMTVEDAEAFAKAETDKQLKVHRVSSFLTYIGKLPDLRLQQMGELQPFATQLSDIYRRMREGVKAGLAKFIDATSIVGSVDHIGLSNKGPNSPANNFIANSLARTLGISPSDLNAAIQSQYRNNVPFNLTTERNDPIRQVIDLRKLGLNAVGQTDKQGFTSAGRKAAIGSNNISLGPGARPAGGFAAVGSGGNRSKGKSSKHGNRSISWGPSINQLAAEHDAMQAIADEYSEFGIAVPGYSARSIAGYRNPSPEFLNSVVSAALTAYENAKREFFAKVEQAKAARAARQAEAEQIAAYSQYFTANEILAQYGGLKSRTSLAPAHGLIMDTGMAIEQFRGKIAGFEDSLTLKDFIYHDGILDTQAIRELNDRAAFLNLDRYSLVGTG